MSTRRRSGQIAKAGLTAASLIVLLGAAACASNDPADAGWTAELAPCPDKPNCVSTEATDSRHAIDPIAYTGSAEDAILRLRELIAEMPRSSLVAQSDRYLHVEFRSRIFRFVDDVEFVVDDNAKVIRFRSAARMGHSDLGVNRKRMEEIRSRFAGA